MFDIFLCLERCSTKSPSRDLAVSSVENDNHLFIRTFGKLDKQKAVIVKLKILSNIQMMNS